MEDIAKSRIDCSYCNAKGWVYIRISEDDVDRDLCPYCYGSCDRPNPDWLDDLFERTL